MAFSLFPNISQLAMPLPLALPWAGLPDSLDALANMAARLQSITTLAFNHPFWAIVAVVFSIGLIQILADWVKRFIKVSVAFVLKLPLMLSQWIWKRATTTTVSTDASTNASVDQLIARLEALHIEQDQAMAELKSLLSQSKESKLNDIGLPKLMVRSPALEAEAADKTATDRLSEKSVSN